MITYKTQAWANKNFYMMTVQKEGHYRMGQPTLTKPTKKQIRNFISQYKRTLKTMERNKKLNKDWILELQEVNNMIEVG
jgi:hypothetical protein